MRTSSLQFEDQWYAMPATQGINSKCHRMHNFFFLLRWFMSFIRCKLIENCPTDKDLKSEVYEINMVLYVYIYCMYVCILRKNFTA